MRERHNGTRINLGTATQGELEAMRQAAQDRIDTAQAEKFVVEDYLTRRFGGVGVAQVVQIANYRRGQTEREFDLNLFDDGPDGAA